jgi:hypothetical protein
MHVSERRQYEMLVRVRDFGDGYGHLFPTSSVARQNFEAVAAAITELDAHELTHMAASVSARAHRKEIAREALFARLQAISQTARVLAEDTPGLDLQFEVTMQASDQALVTTGRRFARDAEPLSSQFIAHGTPVTFLTDLNALVDAFERAMRDRGLGREARRAARASTQAALASGIAAVRSLNAIVVNHLRGDKVTTIVWEQARRIVYPQRAETTDATREPAPEPVRPQPTSDDKAA